jgi:chromosome segregation and condensation protein ScpB
VERTEGKPPIMRYFTTPRFLGLFGLETLNDLPRSRDLEQN